MFAAAAAAIVVASPTVAAIANWNIVFEAATTVFDHSVDDEITLRYLIGRGRDYNVALFDSGCTNPITGITITHEEERASLTDNHDRLEINIDLDKTGITASNIWSSPVLKFCARVQLLSGEAVIKQNEQDVHVEFILTSEFDNGAVMNEMALETATPIIADINSYISACQCDESFTCNAAALGPDSILKVCITSVDSDVEIVGVMILELFQDNGADGTELLGVVEGYAVQNADLSTMVKSSTTQVVVETIIPSRFFKKTGVSAVLARGQLEAAFVALGRRLVAVKYNVGPSKMGATSARAMTGLVRPGYEGDGESPAAGPIGGLADPDDLTETSDFEVTVGLTNDSAAREIGAARVGLLGVTLGFLWVLV